MRVCMYIAHATHLRVHAAVTKTRHVWKLCALSHSYFEKEENKYKLLYVNTIKCNDNKCAQQ